MKAYRQLLFDVDGTLLDFDAAEERGLKKVLERYGRERLEELTAAYREINRGLWAAYEKGEITKDQITDTRFQALFHRFGIDGDGLRAEEEYREVLNHAAIPMDGAMEVVRELCGRYELYVATNGFSKTQRMRLEDSGLSAYFKKSFISEEAGSQKPQREFFDYCFAHMEAADPSKMLIIGDSLQSDILGGNRAGIDSCWFNPSGAERHTDAKADYEIRDLRELLKWL